MGALDSEDDDPGIENSEEGAWLDAVGLPNSEGAEVEGEEADELWPTLKRVLGAPTVAEGAADVSLEASSGLL